MLTKTNRLLNICKNYNGNIYLKIDYFPQNIKKFVKNH